MCGRICCTLGEGLLPLACAEVTRDPSRVSKGKDRDKDAPRVPVWRDAPCGGKYFPSTNVPPGAYTPVLVRGQAVGREDPYVVQPMLWGIVPRFHKGEKAATHGFTTNNARIEGVKKSRVYKPSLERDQRCVVVCDGFYEWKTFDDKSKQPYLIFPAQSPSCDEDLIGRLSEVKGEDVWDGEKKWSGPRLLFMAGLFSVWHKESDKDEREPVYSYTIITRDSNEALDWLHERMPAILPDFEAVQEWLNPDLKGLEAVDILKPVRKSEISWHPVSPAVGNVRNKGAELPKKVQLDKSGKAIKREANMMASWLVKKPKLDEDLKKEKEEDEK